MPAFLGIGALKAGTTYLDAMLRSHPGLSLPLHRKEVQFFDRYYERGMSWYARQYARLDDRPRGEVSPQYLFCAECPARIARANPAARLLVTVRQPVTRAFSQYRHWVQESGYRADFATFVREYPGAVERSRYWTLLQRYRDHFPDEQIRVVVFEDMAADHASVLREVYGFLGVDVAHQPDALDDAVYASMVARFPRVYVAGKRISRVLYEHGQGRVVELVKKRGRAALLRGGRTDAAARPSGPPADVAARLADDVRADAAALSSYVGRDLVSLWGMAPRSS